MQRHELQIFADYHQFYLQDDDDSYGDLSDAWTEEATERLLAVAPHVVGIGTVRNVNVPVSIEIYERQPSIDHSEWDQLNLASLEVTTGRLVVAGCTDYYPDAVRIEMPPGTYEVLVCYSGLDTISENGLEGNDRYSVAIYPGKLQEPQVLKARGNG